MKPKPIQCLVVTPKKHERRTIDANGDYMASINAAVFQGTSQRESRSIGSVVRYFGRKPYVIFHDDHFLVDGLFGPEDCVAYSIEKEGDLPSEVILGNAVVVGMTRHGGIHTLSEKELKTFEASLDGEDHAVVYRIQAPERLPKRAVDRRKGLSPSPCAAAGEVPKQ